MQLRQGLYTATVCGLLVCSTVCLARVSMTIPGRVDTFIAREGGSQVYASNILVNNQDAKLRMFRFKDASDVIGPRLIQSLGGNTDGFQEGAMMALDSQFGKSWLFVLPSLSPDVSSVILLESSGSLNDEDPQWIFNDLPQPAGFTPTFSMVDGNSKFALCSGTSHMPSTDAMGGLRHVMERSGWTAATPGVESASALFYQKGDEIVLVSASPAGSGSNLLLMKKE